jgi:hypothetical protein
MHRTPTGKRLALTERDIEIFKLLARYRYLPSTFIHAFVGGRSENRLKERLGDLFHEGYIDRPDQQWEFANARHRPAVYESDSGAARTLREVGITVDDRRTFFGETAHRQLLHSLMICQVLASLDLGVRADTSLRFIAWPEILGRAPEATRSSGAPFRLPVHTGGYLIPDGLFGIEYGSSNKKAYRFFALEADRGTMPVTRSNGNQTSYLGKLAAYREIIAERAHKAQWGVSTLVVLTVTTSESRLRDILQKLEAQGGGAAFLFKAVDASDLRMPSRQFIFEPWQRAGLPPLGINT